MSSRKWKWELSINDRRYFWLLLVAEKALSVLIMFNVAYTEIDWTAYMQQTQLFAAGERNYSRIEGATGPLVYPAGFLYVFSLLNAATDGGRNVGRAQWIFADFGVLTLFIVLTLYGTSRKTPWFAAPMLLLSKRIHSIFVLRLFNDPVAMLPLYFAIYALIKSRPLIAALLFSFSVSIKMNTLLFAPAFALITILSTSVISSMQNAILFALFQIVLAFPFLVSGFGLDYVSRAFEFSRQFLFEWTVNWRFLGENVFLSREFSIGLLLLHLAALALFMEKWCRPYGGLFKVIEGSFYSSGVRKLDPDFILTTMFTSNLIGITFARSLHYQFYSWYFYTIPYLLFRSSLIPLAFKFLIFVAIEYCWNVFPSTIVSSVLLFLCHIAMIIALYIEPDDKYTFVTDRNGISKRKVKTKRNPKKKAA